MKLYELKKGHDGVITDIDLLAPCIFRLIDLGFIPGSRVSMLARAPLGDPMLVQLRRHTFMLRKSEAQYVSVSEEKP